MISIFSLKTCTLRDIDHLTYYVMISCDSCCLQYIIMSCFGFQSLLHGRPSVRGLISYWALSHKTKPNIFRGFGDWRGTSDWGGIWATDWRRFQHIGLSLFSISLLFIWIYFSLRIECNKDIGIIYYVDGIRILCSAFLMVNVYGRIDR